MPGATDLYFYYLKLGCSSIVFYIESGKIKIVFKDIE